MFCSVLQKSTNRICYHSLKVLEEDDLISAATSIVCRVDEKKWRLGDDGRKYKRQAYERYFDNLHKWDGKKTADATRWVVHPAPGMFETRMTPPS